MVHHSRPRYTGDLDLWVEPSSENAERVLAVRHVFAKIGRMQVPFIGLKDLKANTKASGRLKDLQDLEELP